MCARDVCVPRKIAWMCATNSILLLIVFPFHPLVQWSRTLVWICACVQLALTCARTHRRMAKLFADLPLACLNGEIEDAFNQIDSDGGGSLDMSVRFVDLLHSPNLCTSTVLLQQWGHACVIADCIYLCVCARACMCMIAGKNSENPLSLSPESA